MSRCQPASAITNPSFHVLLGQRVRLSPGWTNFDVHAVLTRLLVFSGSTPDTDMRYDHRSTGLIRVAEGHKRRLDAVEDRQARRARARARRRRRWLLRAVTILGLAA